MSGDGVEQLDAAIRAALEQRPASCWERLLDAADELVELHEVPVEEVIAGVRLAFSAGGERVAAH
jgi:hypothetical protein